MEAVGEDAEPRWRVGWAFGGLAAGYFLAFLAVLVWTGVTGRTDLSFGAIALTQVALWTGFLGAVVLAARRDGSGSVRRDFGLSTRWRDAMVGVPVGLVCQLVVVPLLYLPFRELIDVDDLERPARELAEKAHGVGFVLLAVVLAVGAPIVEELFFRGLLLRSLSRRFGDRWGLAGSSVAFAAVHFQLLQFPALLVVGVVFGFLAQRYGRLGPSMSAHAAFNGIVVAALAISR